MRKLIAFAMCLCVTSFSLAQSQAQLPIQPIRALPDLRILDPEVELDQLVDPTEFGMAFGVVKGFALLSFLIPVAIFAPEECALDIINGAFIPSFIPARIIGYLVYRSPLGVEERYDLRTIDANEACVDLDRNGSCGSEEPRVVRDGNSRLNVVTSSLQLSAGLYILCLLPGIILPNLNSTGALAKVSWSVGATILAFFLVWRVAHTYLPHLPKGRDDMSRVTIPGLTRTPVSGGGTIEISSSITMINSGPAPSTAQISLLGQDGQAGSATIDGVTAGFFEFEIPAFGSVVKTLEPIGPVEVLWGVCVGSGIECGATFSTTIGGASLTTKVSTQGGGATSSAGLGGIVNLSTSWNVAVCKEGDLNTAFAVFNGTSMDATVTLILEDQAGNEVSTSEMDLPAFNQVANFATTAAGAAGLGDFKGTLRVLSTTAIGVLTLSTVGGVATSSQTAGSLQIQ